MPKSRYNKLSASSEEQAQVEDLKSCKKVFCLEENNNVVQRYVSPEQEVVKPVSKTQNKPVEFGLSKALRKR